MVKQKIFCTGVVMLYSYIMVPNKVLQEGIKAPALLSEKDLQHYAGRAGTARKAGIEAYLETVFPGRSRAISCLTEQVPDTGSRKIREFKKLRECFCFSEEILKDAQIVEAVWLIDGDNVNPAAGLDFSSPAWETVRDDDDLFFKRIRHYMLVLKNGFLPAGYIKKASD